MSEKKLFQQSNQTYDTTGLVVGVEEQHKKSSIFIQSNKTYDNPLFAEEPLEKKEKPGSK